MSKAKETIFFTIYFLFSIMINLVNPVTATYMRSIGLSSSYFVAMYLMMYLGQVFGSLIFGYLSDKIGRKWIISIGIIGYCLCQIGFGFLYNWPGLMLTFRFLSGLFVGAPNALFISMCLDFSNDNNSAKHLSIMSFGSVIGAAFGYEIGGSLKSYASLTFQQVFVVQIVVGCLIGIAFALLIKDINKPEQTKSGKSNFSFKNFIGLKYIVYILLIGLFFLGVGQVLINKFFDAFITWEGQNKYGDNVEAMLGHYVFGTGVVAAFANLLIIPFLKKIKGNKSTIILISFVLISAIMTFITFLVQAPDILYLLCTTHLVYIILKALIVPLEQKELSLYTNGQNNGQLMGARHTAISIGNIIGLVTALGFNVTDGDPTIFIIAASILLVSALIYIVYFILKLRQQTTEKVEKE